MTDIELVRTIHSFGDKYVDNYQIEMKTKPEPNEIKIQTKMVGVCRSDIDQYTGKIAIPLGHFGHESLGQVIAVGDDLSQLYSVGDYVASNSDPAYADYFYSTADHAVKVPSLDPKYIIEPVACAINIAASTLMELRTTPHINEVIAGRSKILLIGSGFLSNIIAQYFKNKGIKFVVTGSHNLDKWSALNTSFMDLNNLKEMYPAVINLSPNQLSSTNEFLKQNGVMVLAADSSDYKFDIGKHLWDNNKVIFPSPRSSNFHTHMNAAVELIRTGILNVDWVWSKYYNRDTEFRQAFEEGITRPENYVRGYIKY